jgi:hypothetical protein
MFPCASIPRPEYPRPDRQRGRVEGVDWLNLNGPWQFRFDPDRHGIDEAWFAPAPPDWREQIVVPFCWESLAAWGEGDAAGSENYFSTRVYRNPLEVTRANHRSAPRHEVGWYRRRVLIPDGPEWRERRVILTIGAADFFTRCWCNGRLLGEHEGGYDPFEFDLTDALETDAEAGRVAVIVLRVEDPMDNREQPVGKQWGWYTPTSGIWQTVFIEPRAAAHMSHFRIRTDVDASEASFEVFCPGAADGLRVGVEIVSPAGGTTMAEFDVLAETAVGAVALSDPVLWHPGNPQLYRVVFRLGGADGELDEVRSYFGMRKISTRPAPDNRGPAMLCLNNEPIYLRGALYQSYHPAGIYTAPDARTLAEDLAFAREAGFDFLRIHIKLDDPLLLYYADTQGILLMQDFPNFGEGGDTALGRQRFETMMRRGLRRDFNHPSIIAWCLFNETWGFGGQTELMKWIGPLAGKNPVQAVTEKTANETSFAWVHRMWEIAKTIDPTRLIEDMSVVAWEHLKAYGHVETDINSWHFYLDDYARAKAHIEDVVAQSYRGSKFNFVEGYAQSDAPLINSEFGGVGALDGNRDCSWSFKFLTNELRRHARLSAYIYTELHDVEWEYNGLLAYDRTRKQFGFQPAMINEGDVLPINAPPIRACAPGERMEIEVLSSHFSRRRRENITLHWLYSGIDSLGTVYPDLARGRAPIAFPHYQVGLARRLEVAAPAETMLCTLSVAAVTPEGEVVASNFIQHHVTANAPTTREERDGGRTLVLRCPIAAWSAAEWPGGAATPEEASRLGYCFGRGAGFFEWELADDALRQLGRARRVRLLCEVSARREEERQTSAHRTPTMFELSVNGLRAHRQMLPDHPHDSRGALTYLRGGRGAHGYLMRATVEGELLQRLAATTHDGRVRLRCAAPADDAPAGGLTVYGPEAGRFPLGPTLVLEFDQS